ncbi:MAG: phosphatase PAP2 family protein [Clostridiales Family XIII bacterium]|jgi:undecaprenyl-diphosphatase|nr:phosphatase PAP2 family protein [Clostridiales Family XIII bacterium]
MDQGRNGDLMEIYSQKKEPFIRWIVLGVLVVLFLADMMLVLTDKAAIIDDPGINFMRKMRSPFLSLLAVGVTHLADTKIVIGICLVLLVLPQRMKLGLPLSIATGLASGVHYTLKLIIHRPRPEILSHLVEESGYSFPSGHSNAGVVFFLFLMVLLYRYLAINGRKGLSRIIVVLFPFLVIFIGISRVYVGVHYPTDVLGGWLLGGCLLIVFVTLYDSLYPSKWRITREQPEWEMIRKQKPWKHPVNKEAERIDFPRNRSPWKMPTARERQAKEERDAHE